MSAPTTGCSAARRSSGHAVGRSAPDTGRLNAHDCLNLTLHAACHAPPCRTHWSTYAAPEHQQRSTLGDHLSYAPQPTPRPPARSHPPPRHVVEGRHHHSHNGPHAARPACPWRARCAPGPAATAAHSTRPHSPLPPPTTSSTPHPGRSSSCRASATRPARTSTMSAVRPEASCQRQGERGGGGNGCKCLRASVQPPSTSDYGARVAAHHADTTHPPRIAHPALAATCSATRNATCTPAPSLQGWPLLPPNGPPPPASCEIGACRKVPVAR